MSRHPDDRYPSAQSVEALASLRGRAEAQQNASPRERRRRQARERARQARKPLPWPVVVILVFYRFCFILVFTAALSGATLGGLLYSAWQYLETSKSTEVIVPDLTGETQATATEHLEAVGLHVAVESVANADVPAGQVAGLNPSPGRKVAGGRVITIQVSTGPELVTMPRLVGETFAAAQETIGRLGLKIGNSGRKPDLRWPAGTVITQSPGAGRRVTTGTRVDMYVSAGPPGGDDGKPAGGSTVSQPTAEDAGDDSRERRVGTVIIPVPSKPDLSTIRIVLRDEDGEQTVFDQICHAGDIVRQTVRGVGEATVEVYINDRKVKEQDL